MKNMLIFSFLLSCVFSMVQGQTKNPSENVVITFEKDKNLVQTNENGELLINVSPKDVIKFKANGFIRYSDFGAEGDGKTDDTDAIASTHAFANQLGLPVKADDGATYYIGGKNRTAVIRTNTDFGNAAFIINDTAVRNRNAHVFLVSSSLQTTTIANSAESKYNYYSRGIAIRRSNVLVTGLEHRITGEGDHGAPYGGFINIGDCAYVTIRNTILTGHKVYQTIGSAGVSVSMGTYDISINRALNVSFVNCTQTNDINDSKYWGILGSNYCKNLVYDSCTLSRFDAHMGVANATIRNSTLGHQGINAIGSGTFIVENSTIYGRNLINLRSDYGSTWQGEFLIRNCTFIPVVGRTASVSLIGGSYSGQHDFGYTCFMPERITIENLRIDDSKLPDAYKGPAIFADFNPEMTNDSYVEKFPYVITREVILRNVTISSGKTLRLSDNPFIFRNVKINSDH
jgi:hypothetical protein